MPASKPAVCHPDNLPACQPPSLPSAIRTTCQHASLQACRLLSVHPASKPASKPAVCYPYNLPASQPPSLPSAIRTPCQHASLQACRLLSVHPASKPASKPAICQPAVLFSAYQPAASQPAYLSALPATQSISLKLASLPCKLLDFMCIFNTSCVNTVIANKVNTLNATLVSLRNCRLFLMNSMYRFSLFCQFSSFLSDINHGGG